MVYPNVKRSGGGSAATATILVADAPAMQVIIDAGSVAIGQLFSLISDRSIRRFEGGNNSRIIEKYYNNNPTGYARFVTTNGANISVRVDVTGSTGWCYSVDGGAPAYFIGSSTTLQTIPIPSDGGVPHRVDIWSANDVGSGPVGDINYLDCFGNNLASIDVSGLTALAYLKCYANNLTSLDLSGLTALTSLSCYNNNLTSLDVSGFTALTYLGCSTNNLTSLDLSGLTALTSLSCYNNNLTSLDVSGLTALSILECYGNNLTALDASGLTALSDVACYDNNLTSLDVSGLAALSILQCHGTSLTSLDVSGLTALKYFQCYNNPNLAVLNISNCTDLALAVAHTCPSLVSVIAVGSDGAGYYSYSSYQMDFSGSGLTTDAVYAMLDQMIAADPSPSWINVTDSPCDGGTTLVDGVINTGADTEALALAKSYTLII